MDNLDKVLKDLNKDLGNEGAFQKGIKFEDAPRIPFSSPEFNYMTYGGLPQKGIVEFAGEESSGKSTMALDVIKNYQKMETGREIIYADAERTLDPEWSAKLGVNVDNIIVYSPTEKTYCEKMFDDLLKAIETIKPGLVILDSIGSLVSNTEMENDVEKANYGGISMPLTKFVKKLNLLVSQHNILFIGINQVRDDLSGFHQLKTPGGRAWKFMCSMRIEFRRGKFVDENNKEVSGNTENPYGHIVEARIIKNKICPSDRRIAHTILRYADGIDFVSGIIEIATKKGNIQKAGAFYSIIDITTGAIQEVDGQQLKFQGLAKLKEYLQEHQDILNKIDEQIRA
jgi:recombination protein RecA